VGIFIRLLSHPPSSGVIAYLRHAKEVCICIGFSTNVRCPINRHRLHGIVFLSPLSQSPHRVLCEAKSRACSGLSPESRVLFFQFSILPFSCPLASGFWLLCPLTSDLCPKISRTLRIFVRLSLLKIYRSL